MIYDIIVDLIKHLSISLSFLKPYATLLGVIVLLLRQNNIKKIINGKLPKRFRDTQSNDIYDMMRDIKAIKEHLGVDVSNTQESGSSHEVRKSYEKLFLLLRKANILRRIKNMERLKSRKFWLTVAAALLPVINAEFNINLDFNTIALMVTAIMGGVGFIAHVDATKLKTTVKTLKTPIVVDHNATYQDMFPTIKEVHEKINKLLELAKTNDVNVLAIYPRLNELLLSYEHPNPVTVVEDKVIL